MEGRLELELRRSEALKHHARSWEALENEKEDRQLPTVTPEDREDW
jgi:hypothetical protein